MMYGSLLNYWYALEFFEPCYPVKEGEDYNLMRDPLPWTVPYTDERSLPNYEIYFGKGISYDLICWMLNVLGLDRENEPIERDQTPTCVCALKLDSDGQYVPGSFAVSSFVWALGRIAEEGDIQASLDQQLIEKLQRDIDSAMTEHKCMLQRCDLEEIYRRICSEIGADTMPLTESLWAKQKLQWRKKDGTFPELDPVTELMGSFYLSDLRRAAAEPTKQLQDYAEALARKLPKRTEIDIDIHAMEEELGAEKFPRGMWPSVYSPGLMQQVAINLGCTNQGIFSVNGPPGTGKTTLLKEIIASNVVERARAMSEWAHPDDAFAAKKLSDPPDQFNATYYVPSAKLTPFGILVASNNNAAVENISVELPKAIAKDRTMHFVQAEDDGAYFPDIAGELIGAPAWGLISARLGKRSHLKSLKDRLWWAQDGATLRHYYDEGVMPDWDEAKRAFQLAWDRVEAARREIRQAQQAVPKWQAAQEKLQAKQSELAGAKRHLAEREQALSDQKAEIERTERTYALTQENILKIKSGLPFWKRIFRFLFRKNPVVQEWYRLEEKCGQLLVELTRLREGLPAKEDKKSVAERAVDTKREETAAQEHVVAHLYSKVKAAKERFGHNFAEGDFWENISWNAESQISCPWTDTDYDRLREDLFYRALMVQKAFVLNSKCVKQNLMRLFSVWDGKFTSQQREVIYGSLLNTLFFVIPVISTTFASVQTFLEGIQKEELGLLIIDEAGQATPQSAVGAIWRTKRAIVVGDPLQVEPISTVPKELCKRFADQYHISGLYRSQELSVQVLADEQNAYGGWRNVSGEKIWLGCPLVVHRRCVQPMFQISNEIAYNGRMIYQSAEPNPEKPFLMNRSKWYQVVGKEKGGKNHTVPEQIDLTVKLVTAAIEKFGTLPDLYIITPFRSVSSSLKNALRAAIRTYLSLPNEDIKSWLDEHCGTVHTFQGKEANEVLLVLGCDAQSGSGAARWVGQKPNIINVAVSRAKYRLGVIGDRALWKDVPYVGTLCKYLADN